MSRIANHLFTAALTSAVVALTIPQAAFAAASQACLDSFSSEALLAPRSESKSIDERIDAAIKTAISVETGRKIYVEAVPPARPELPTFILMPGMNRSSMLTDPSSQTLFAMGYGVAIFNFSVHPHSVNEIEKGISPYFRSKDPLLTDFAVETNLVAETLRKSFGVTNLVPVSLSFSGAVTPFLKNYPLIIETVPMTEEHAANPQGASARASLALGQIFNPIFGPGIIRATMDAAYRNQWKAQAESMIKSYSLDPSRESDFIEGYTAMSRSAEDASWKDAKLDPKTRRVFIVAQNDSPVLLLSQLQTFKALLAKQPNSLLFFIGHSGHIVPVDQPAIYASTLAAITNADHAKQTGVAILIPPAGEEKGQYLEFSGAKANEWLDKEITRLQNQ